MARRKTSALPLALGLGLLLLVLALALATPRAPLPVGGFRIPGVPMTEEVSPPQVLYATTLSLEPGQVYQVTYDANGISIQLRSSRLIERVNLTNVDVSVNDVVAWHGYDWYFDGKDDYVVFSGVDKPAMAASTDEITFGARFRVVSLPSSWAPVFGWPDAPGCPDIHVDGYDIWHHVCVNGSRVSVFVQRHEEYGTLGGWKDDVVVFSAKNRWRRWYVNGVLKGQTTNWGGDINFTTTSGGVYMGRGRAFLNYVMSHAFISTKAWTDAEYRNYFTKRILDSDALAFFADATFFNGSHYIDLASGAVGTPHGGVKRVPAEHTWLWIIRNLASDNKLHLKFVPAGSVFRIRYNGMIYEWRIPEDCKNAAGLCEDYAIDIASIFGTTVLPNATIELIYDSPKVRFYIPSGFQVVVEGSGWSETHEVPLNSSYVDFGLPASGTYTVKILGYEEEPRVRVETSGDLVRVTVTDSAGYALAGAKVYVYDTSGNLVATGLTNDLGFYEFSRELLGGDQVRVAVVALKDGVFYRADKLVSLSSTVSAPEQTSAPQAAAAAAASSSASSAAPAVLLLLLVLAVTVVALAARRR